MAEVKVYYNEQCQNCGPYLADMQHYSDANKHNCKFISLQSNPSSVISDLQSLRATGHVVSSFPFFVVMDGEHTYSYEGILDTEIIVNILRKFA
jgi:hypothetical protein